MDVHLRENVRIHNDKGIKLNTDSLNWQQKSNTISTNDKVEVSKKDSVDIKAKGLDADTKLNQVSFKQDVKVALFDNKNVIKINCAGPLEIDYNKGKAVFNNNVVVDNVQGKMFAHKVTVYFDSKTSSIIKVVAEGDVKVVRDYNVTFADRAVYYGKDNKIVLKGRPRLVILPQGKPGLSR